MLKHRRDSRGTVPLSPVRSPPRAGLSRWTLRQETPMPKAILQSVIACSLVVPAAASPTPPWEIVGGWLAFLGDSFGDHWVAYLVGSLAACAVMLLVYVIWDMSLSLLDSNDRLGLLGLMAVLVGPLFVLGLFEGAWYWFDGAWWRGVLHLFRALTGGCLVFAGVILLGAEHLPYRSTLIWLADRLQASARRPRGSVRLCRRETCRLAT